MEQQFVKAYYDQNVGWRLFMPDGTEMPGQCKAQVTVYDNWQDTGVKPLPTVKIEMPCEVINELPK
jgi:hypothetical protein